MRFRNVFLGSFLLVTLVSGVWFFVDPMTTGLFRPLTPDFFKSTRYQPDDFFTSLSNNFAYLLNVIEGNHGLVFYGAVGLLGVLMVVLAIASATSAPKDSTQAMLELLKQEKEKAENLAKLKSEFLNQVSHELRTPLAVIIGYIECMTDGLYGQLESRHQEILQAVSKQSTHLKNMIDQILIFSRLEASRQPVRIEEFSIHKVTNELKETFEFLCRQKEIGLMWEVPTRVGTLQSDPERLKEILSNLLQNAVKYTDRGSIRVGAREDTATDSITIEVADTGMGIPEQSLATIFEPFIQVHKTSTENSRGGIGLGLSIVKKHVEQIKGTISVDSELGKGSTFRITLPRVYHTTEPRYRKLLRFLKSVRSTGARAVVKAKEPSNTQAARRVTDAPRLN